MAGDYKVSISLAMKVRDYVTGADQATKATNRLRDAQSGVAGSSQQMAAGLTRAGEAARESAGHLKAVSAEVGTLTRRTKALADAQDRLGRTGAGSSPARPNVAPNLMPSPRTMGAGGQQAGQAFSAGMSQSLSRTLGPPVIAGLVGGAVAAAPLVGAAVVGGVLGAVGGGAIAAGIAASVRDPRVGAAFDGLQADAGKVADAIGRDFAGEVLDSIKVLRSGVREIGPDLRAAIAPAQSYLEPLAKGFSGFVDQLMPGIRAAVEGAAPIIDVLASELPELGATIGDVFAGLAEHADEGAAAVQLIIYVFEDLLTIGGNVIGFLADRFAELMRVTQVGLGVLSTLPDELGGGFFREALSGVSAVVDTIEGGANKVVPAAGAVGSAIGAVAGPTAELTARQQVLNSSMTDGIQAAGGLKQALDVLNGAAVSAQQAEIDYQEAIDQATKARKANGRSLDENTEKGRANLRALDALRAAGEKNAQAAYDSAKATGTVADAEAAAAKSYERGGAQLIKTYMQFDNNRSRAVAYANAIMKIPTSWQTQLKVQTSQAVAAAEALRLKIASIKSKSIYLTGSVYWTSKGDMKVPGGTITKNAAGGVYTPMAAGGVVKPEIYPASNPPLYRFAEPETGGELFLPRKGDKERGREILATGAEWYGMRMVPMARGGITAAARGLVNVGGPAQTPTTRLDSAEAYLSARTAVKSLSAALKENGATLSVASKKGQENRAAVYSTIRAAQDAAKAKYAETGSVRAANREYDAHLRRLNLVLAQQKVSVGTRRALLRQVGGRPTYDATAAPRDSASTIGAVQARIGAEEAVGKARSFFDASWGKPTFGVSSAFGRDNLTQLFEFLQAAQQAAQARFTQSGSRGLASKLYDSYIRQLRTMLVGAGMAKRDVDKLLTQYGRITLSQNATGGIHMARDGLVSMNKAMALPAGGTLYGWREPSTGGEAFVPKNGDRERGERILRTASGWYGGRYVRGNQSSGGGGMTVRVVVDDHAVKGLVRVEVDEQFGALADAHVYATSN